MRTVVVVMGVSGSGKSTVAASLAAHLRVPFAEGDTFHPAANIAKMTSGVPLTDEDREPWLRAVAAWMATHTDGAVVTCSALKRPYRDLLRTAAPDVWFVHLHGARELLADRIGHRSGHFMPATMLDSQLADLQPLAPDEPGVTLDVSAPPERLVDEAIAALEAHQR